MTATPTTGSTTGSTGLSATEVVNSLTGYDEQKIEQHFGAPVEALSGAKFIRALLFGYFMHQGVEAKTAHKQVMGLTQAAVSEYFNDEEDADGDPGDEAGSLPAPPAAPGAADVEPVAPPQPSAVLDAADVPDADGVPVGKGRPVADSPQA